MARYVLVVRANAADGRHQDFNRWYDQVHLTDVLRVPGFVSARRLRLATTDPPQSSEHEYLALYEIEAETVDRARHALTAAVERGAISLDDALDRASVSALYFAEISARGRLDS